MKILGVLLSLIVMLTGCKKEVEILDGSGMVYKDSDYRTEYANCLPFEDTDYMWAIAFLGYGQEGEKNKEYYLKEYFSDLSQEEISKIVHLDFTGDEWYLIVPRYKEINNINSIDAEGKITEEKSETIQNGEAFIINCNVSDLYSNVKISMSSYGGYEFSPLISLKDGKVAAAEFVMDITKE